MGPLDRIKARQLSTVCISSEDAGTGHSGRKAEEREAGVATKGSSEELLHRLECFIHEESLAIRLESFRVISWTCCRLLGVHAKHKMAGAEGRAAALGRARRVSDANKGKRQATDRFERGRG